MNTSWGQRSAQPATPATTPGGTGSGIIAVIIALRPFGCLSVIGHNRHLTPIEM